MGGKCHVSRVGDVIPSPEREFSTSILDAATNLMERVFFQASRSHHREGFKPGRDQKA
jgi:hypothetical protein